MQNFVTLEICKQADGRIGVPVNAHETIEDAREAFYGKCKLAVKSAYPIHTVMLLNDAGGIVEGPKCFRHVQPDPGPEEEDEGGEDVNAPA